MSLPPDLKIAHPNRFGGRWVEGKTNGMNYYQAARGKDLCQDRARMKLALAATPCCITPHHIKSQILHCNVSHRFCRSRPPEPNFKLGTKSIVLLWSLRVCDLPERSIYQFDTRTSNQQTLQNLTLQLL